jgi:hypothetical protein
MENLDKIKVNGIEYKQEVLEIIKDFKNRSNKELIKVMDLITQDFEYTKNTLVDLSKHLDKLEYTYDLILKEYNNRNGSR